MRRDRLTFAMIIGVPIMQLVLFGYAINTDPKQLPTAVIVADDGPIDARDRRGAADLRLLRHRRRRRRPRPTAREQLRARRRQPSSSPFPPASSATLVRGERPQLLVEADATDPAATANALGALSEIVAAALARGDRRPARRASRRARLPVEVDRAPPLQSRGHHRATTSCPACSASS